MADTDPIEAFIARWSQASGSERANCQLFVTELCAVLDLPVLKSLHDDLDAAVLATYGWADLQATLANHSKGLDGWFAWPALRRRQL